MHLRYLRASVTLLLLGVVSACSIPLELEKLRKDTELKNISVAIDNVPFYPQQDYQCGPAALAMVLNWSGIEVSADRLVPLVFVPDRKGSFQAELIAASRTFGRIPYVIDPSLEALLIELESGFPILVLQNLGLDWMPQWHYAIVTALDTGNETVRLHSGLNRDYKMSLETFLRTWSRARKWAILVLPPDRIASTAVAEKYISSVMDFARVNKPEHTHIALNNSVSRWPENITVRMALANFLFEQNDFSEAKIQFEQAIQIDDQYAPAHNNLANLLLRLKDYDVALQHAEKAVTLGGKFQATYTQTLNEINAAKNSSAE